MKIISILFLIFYPGYSFAQHEIQYEQLDSVSNFISSHQQEMNDITIGDTEKFEIFFPESNFKIWYHNKRASLAMYKIYNSKEVLELSENIDLSTASKIRYYKEIPIGDLRVRVWRITFPDSSVAVKIYENEVYARSLHRNYIDIFELAKKNNPMTQFYNVFIGLSDLINELKKAKNQFPYEVQKISNAWRNTHRIDAHYAYEAFLEQYPNTIFTDDVKSSQERLVRLSEKEKKKFSYINDFAAKNRFQKNLSLEAFIRFNPAAEMLTRYPHGTDFQLPATLEEKSSEGGPLKIHVNTRDQTVSSYYHNLLITKDYVVAKKYLDNLKDDFTKGLDKVHLQISDTRIDVINLPFSEIKISIYMEQVKYGYRIVAMFF